MVRQMQRQNILNKLLKFKRDQQGQVIILFAILLVPMLLMVGGMIDYGIMLSQQNKDQQAIDMAVLAAAKKRLAKSQFPTDEAKQAERVRVFNEVYNINVGRKTNHPNFTFNFEEGGMKVIADSDTDGNILKFIGIDKLEYQVGTGAAYTKNGTFEIVIVFDSTGSMGGIIGTVKSNAIKFTPDILTRLQEKGVIMDDIMTKVIDYKDYWADSAPMTETQFFDLPTEQSDFASVVNAVSASGGGDHAESGLEAIVLAMRSESPDRVANVPANKLIVLWTDIEAIPFIGNMTNHAGQMTYPPNKNVKPLPARYPAHMPNTLLQFQTEWAASPTTELLIFTPGGYPWDTLESWERVTHIKGNPNSIAYSTVIDNIAEAMSNFSGLRLTN